MFVALAFFDGDKFLDTDINKPGMRIQPSRSTQEKVRIWSNKIAAISVCNICKGSVTLIAPTRNVKWTPSLETIPPLTNSFRHCHANVPEGLVLYNRVSRFKTEYYLLKNTQQKKRRRRIASCKLYRLLTNKSV